MLEPGRPYVHGWHIDALAEHLEAVSDGRLLRLLINVPPGTMKSLATSVAWPAWEWGPRNEPWRRYVCASYSRTLSIRDNRRCRRLVESDWYRARWGDRVRLVGDQNAKELYETSATGFKLATSVGGVGTGQRGDRVIIDDPHNVLDGESAAKRLEAILWFTEVMPTRLNDPKTSAIVVIMQRVHEADVSGEILARELGYEHLMLPMRFEPERRCSTAIGFTDPRTAEGELLFPARFPPEVVERDEKVLGEYATAGQLQQRPAPRKGGLFDKAWLGIVPAAPAGLQLVRAWDLAATDPKPGQEPSWTVGLLLGRDRAGLHFVVDVVRLRGNPGAVEAAIVNTAKQDGRGVTIDLPQDPGQAGKAQIAHLVARLAGHAVVWSPESGDKVTRATPVSAQAEAGNVKLVEAPWNRALLDELGTAPRGKFTDQMDALSRAFHRLLKMPRVRAVAPGGANRANPYR